MNSKLNELKNALRLKGYRLTKQRKATVEAIIANQDKHMSAEEIYLAVKQSFPEIGLATVYRNMLLFEETGFLNKHNFDDGRNRYELNNPDEDHHHHHLVCVACGSVTEVEEDLLDLLEDKIRRQHQFEIIDHKLKFTGFCRNCKLTDN